MTTRPHLNTDQATKALQEQMREFSVKALGRIGGGSWQTPTLLNGWTDFGGDFATAAYRTEPAGTVRLRGLIVPGTAQHVFTLPSGFRPADNVLFTGATGATSMCRVDVWADGTVRAYNLAASFVSLSQVSFRADG